MEFYLKFHPIAPAFRRFQFPTGWNSTHIDDRQIPLVIVSIPNGMEFYSDTPVDTGRLKKFQFPTGWNSTLVAHRHWHKTPVSIPNGMEFYWQYDEKNQWARGAFQFPTGWNSTASGKTTRGGLWKFQFPTGWNSTKSLRWKRAKLRVSIPNGMEFYIASP